MAALGTLLRWLLAPVAAAVVVAGIVVAARWAVSVAAARCPADSMVAGACVEPWHTSVVEAAIYAAVVLAALALVAVPALVAPALKRSVAVLGFVAVAVAAGAAYFMTGFSDLLAPFVVALVSGVAALTWVWFTRRPVHES